MDVRKPAVAGTFYPGDPEELRKMIADYLDKAGSVNMPAGKLRGLIVPHAGYIYSGPVAAYAFSLLKKAQNDRFILLGPSHYGLFPGLAEAGHEEWQTPLGNVKSFSIRNDSNSQMIHVYPAVHRPEHSVEVQLPFLQEVLKEKKFTVDPIVTGEINPEDGALLLKPFANDSFFVISSDLSHYLPYSEAVARDRNSISLIEQLDLERFMEQGDACGKTGISILMALSRKLGWKIKSLHYANSGDTAGPKTQVVGYGALAIYE